MTMSKTERIRRTTRSIGLVFALLALLAGATTAGAQHRAYHWEFTLGALSQLGADLDFEGGSTVATDDDLGFNLAGTYNITDQLATSFGFQWTGISYDAAVVRDDASLSRIRGSYDTWAMSVNALYHFSDGALAPYVGAGIGWTWIDTNIPTGLPSTGCWWDPWFGWICVRSYPTKTSDAFSYQAILGLRYELSFSTFLRFSYTSQWQDLRRAEDTPRFDVIGLEFGWMF